MSKKYLLNSANCFEGYNKEDECWVSGDYDYLINNDNIDSETHHHRYGTGEANLYFLTENNMKKSKVWNVYNHLGFDDFEYDEFKKIRNNLTPIKLSKNNNFYEYNSYIRN